MRILVCPFGEIEGNAYQYYISNGLQENGFVVDNFADHSVIKEKYDYFVIHWPELFAEGKNLLKALYNTFSFISIIFVLKIRKTKIIWIGNDLKSHKQNNPILERFLMYIFTHNIDGFVSLSDSALNYAFSIFPVLKKKRYTVIPQTHYKEIYINNTTKNEARSKIGLDKKEEIILFIGNIDFYKGVVDLINVFINYKANDARLVLAGILKDDTLKEFIENAIKKDKRILLFPNYIPNDQIQYFINASDMIVLPFKRINNSGSLVLALGFNKYVLAPSFPQIVELKEKYANDLLLTYDGELNSSNLISALHTSFTMQPEYLPDFKDLEPINVSKRFVEFIYLLKENKVGENSN